MPRVILTGKDWKERALLRAQLLHEGIDVEAWESAHDALEGRRFPVGLPELLVADLGPSERPAEELALLSTWAKKIPVWIILSRMHSPAERTPESGIERIILRPVDLSALVQEIMERVKQTPSETHSLRADPA
jgi:CheY-like chemotaxis protein